MAFPEEDSRVRAFVAEILLRRPASVENQNKTRKESRDGASRSGSRRRTPKLPPVWSVLFNWGCFVPVSLLLHRFPFTGTLQYWNVGKKEKKN